MRVYILLHKDQDDYSSLPPDAQKVFIFDKIGNPSEQLVDEALNKLVAMLDSSTTDDRIIFNGPSWLIALAGYIWMSRGTMDSLSTLGCLAYDNFKKQYVELNNGY